MYLSCPKTIQAHRGRIKDKPRLCDANELMRDAICWVERVPKKNRRTTRQPPGATIHNAHTRFHHCRLIK